MSAVNSNVSRPMPRANTGSWFLNLVSNTDDVPFADGTPNRSLASADIRRHPSRSNRAHGHRIDEHAAQGRRLERLPRKSCCLTRRNISTRSSRVLPRRCEDSGNPADLSAAGTPKLKASCAASLSFTTIFRRNFATASMPNRKRSVAGSAFPGRVLTSRRTSTTSDS